MNERGQFTGNCWRAKKGVLARRYAGGARGKSTAFGAGGTDHVLVQQYCLSRGWRAAVRVVEWADVFESVCRKTGLRRAATTVAVPALLPALVLGEIASQRGPCATTFSKEGVNGKRCLALPIYVISRRAYLTRCTHCR